jgi:hypothetical protein
LTSELQQVNSQIRINCFNTLSEGLKAYFSINPKENNIANEVLDRISEEEKALNRASVASSNINSIGYDENTSTLEIEFLNNSIYQYFDVPQHIYQGLMQADSLGQFLAQNIKGVYRYSKI